eukprot:Gb_13967 [translate_table: standard]
MMNQVLGQWCVERHERVVTLLDLEECPGVTPKVVACQVMVREWSLRLVLGAQIMFGKPWQREQFC